MLTVEDLKQYLRIDTNAEDELLEAFIGTAVAYLNGAVEDYYTLYAYYPEFASKADLLTAVLAGEFYQNRDNSAHDMSYTVRSLMAQLQYFPAEDIDSDSGLTSTDTGTIAMFDANDNLFNSGIKIANEDAIEEVLTEVGLTVVGGE